jgi:hypothetical protein
LHIEHQGFRPFLQEKLPQYLDLPVVVIGEQRDFMGLGQGLSRSMVSKFT